MDLALLYTPRMWLEMVLQAKKIYMHGKNMPSSGSFSIRFKAKL